MKFCRQCHAIMKLEEDARNRRIRFYCVPCKKYYAPDTPKVFSHTIIEQDDDASRHRFDGIRHFEADPSLPRVAISCPKCSAPKTIILGNGGHGRDPFAMFVYCKRRGCRQIIPLFEFQNMIAENRQEPTNDAAIVEPMDSSAS